MKRLILLLACLAPWISAPAAGLPDFKSPDQNGKIWSLADSSDRPLLIDFWATWCVPCLKSIPDLKAFNKKYGSKIQLLGAATDVKGWAKVKPAIAKYKIDYPVIIVKGELAEAYGVEGYPSLKVVKNGKIVKSMMGKHSLNDLEKELAEYIQ